MGGVRSGPTRRGIDADEVVTDVSYERLHRVTKDVMVSKAVTKSGSNINLTDDL